MRNFRKSNKLGYAALLIALILLTAFMLSGCSKYSQKGEETGIFGSPRARYRILSFFFDGVPDPDQEALQTGGKEGKKKGQETVSRVTEHGPFAARQCGGCHERGTNKLLLPIQELCLRCHVIALNRKWVHGPIVSGGCRVCHNPHSSPYPFLLESASTDFCFYCHAKSDIYRNEVHKDVSKCTDCHDAHASDSRMLLK